MKKIILIHGYGIGLNAPPFCKSYGQNVGFEAFDEDIRNKTAIPFRWTLEKTMPFPESLNIFEHINFYNQEKRLTRNANIHYQLDQLLHQENPDLILCHSLGSVLFLNYAQNYQFPSTIKHLIFVQADLSHKTTQFSAQIKEMQNNNQLKITNYYCPYDQALLVTPILDGYIPAGLVGISYPKINNILFPLYGRTNLHASSICNPRLRNEIMKE